MSDTDDILDELALGRQRYAMADTVVTLVRGFRRDYMAEAKASEAFEMLLILHSMLGTHMWGRAASATGIGRDLGMPRKTIRRRLEWLEELGAVKRMGARFAVVPTYMNNPQMLEGFKGRRGILQRATKRMADTAS